MAARWFRASKDGKSFRFVPRFAPLEDRCVPATYYVDPLLAGSADGAAVTFDAGRANATPGLVYAGSSAFALANPAANAFGSLRAALDAAAGNADPADTVLLATGQIPLDNSEVTLDLGDGTFVNSVPVTQSLTLRGGGAGATAVTPTDDTRFDNGEFASPDEFTSVFRVDGPDASLDASGFRFDGGGRNLGVGFSVQNGASARFDGVAVTGVVFERIERIKRGGAPDATGTAVAANAAKSLSFANGSVTGYGRTGLLFVATPGSLSDSTVVGRGAGASVNNGVELQSGAAVSVTGSRVADNAGVAADGSLSSGLLVLDDGLGTNPSKALVVGNTFTGNGVALNVGAPPAFVPTFDGPLPLQLLPGDSSTLDAAYNTLVGNGLGASGLLSLGVQDLARNWWGDASGPFDAAAPGGKGDAIDGPANLSVRPFLSYPTPQLSPADVTGFAAAQADYLRLITTLNVAIDPGTVTPSSVAFAVSFPVGVAANTVEPATLRALQASDFAVTAPAGATVALTGSGAAYTLTVSGLSGADYAVTARLPARVAIDPATGRLTAASNTATVTVPAPPNTAPTVVGALPDRSSGLTNRIGPLEFAVGDDAPLADLVLSATSSDDTVVPAAGVVFEGTGANRTVTLTGLPGKPGVSTVTLSVTDAQGLVTTRSFAVTVVGVAPPPPPANAAPTLTAIPDQPVGLVNRVGPLTFAVGDDTTPLSSLVLSATSSDDSVVPAGGVVFGGTGRDRTLTLTGLPGKPGTSTVTVTVADAQGLVATRSFAVSVVGVAPPPPPQPPANAAPTLTPIPDQAIAFGGAASFLAFTVGDDTTPAANLTVTVTSSNPSVALPLLDPAVGGGSNRTLSVGSVPGASGSSAITVTVTDAQGLVTSRSFAVTVAAAPAPPPVVVVPPPPVAPPTPPVVPPPVTVPPPVAAPKRTRLFAVAPDAGALPEVQVFGGDGRERFHLLVFEAGFTGGVRVATADFDGDLTDDLVVAAGPGGGPRVRVLSGASGVVLADFFAFDVNFRGGVTVAAADLDGDGVPSIVVAAGPGGGPHVKVVSLNGTTTQSFFAFDAGFHGGVNVAAADLDGDGRAEVVAAAGPGGGPHVKAFTFAAGVPTVTRSYFAFDAGFRGGVSVAAGAFGVAAAQGVGGTNEVRLSGGTKFPAYETGFTGGVRLGSYDLAGDGVDAILAAPGPGGGPRVQAFTPAGASVLNAFAFDNVARSGYFIG